MLCTCNGQPVAIGATNVWTPPYDRFTPCYYVQYIRKNAENLTFNVTYDTEIENVIIRPLSKNVSYTTDGKTLTFTVDEACSLSVEINDNLASALVVFVNDQATEDLSVYKHILHFAPGEHIIDEITVTDDDTVVWLDEGAIVQGKWTFRDVNNLRIGGPGICTMERYPRNAGGNPLVLFHLDHCRNVRLTDVCLFDSCNWTCKLSGCEDVEIDGVKIIGCRGNADGIDVCGSRRVHVQNCFIRTYDDSFVVKGFDTGNVEDLLFEKSVLWNDMARPIEIGVEIRCEKLHNVIFRDIDVIHNLTCYPIFGIHHGDRAQLSEIHFENIRIEHGPGSQLFDFRITDSVWNADAKKGPISGIYIDDIQLVGREGTDFRTLFARMEGFSEEASIQNVHIGKITAYGRDVTRSLQLEIGNYASPPHYLYDTPDKGTVITNIKMIKPFAIGADRLYHGTASLVIENGTDRPFIGNCAIRVFPLYTAAYDETPSTITLQPGEKSELQYEITTTAGKRVIETRCDRIDCRSDTAYFSLPYPLTANAPQPLRFTDCFGREYGDVTLRMTGGWVEIASPVLVRYGLQLYSAAPVDMADNEILFAAEESFFGEAPCIKWKNGEYHTAPEIGNHLEITYVFLNQPKTTIHKTRIEPRPDGIIRFPLATLGLPGDTKKFWLEMELLDQNDRHMPDTLFRSTLPSDTAHMFAEFVVTE